MFQTPLTSRKSLIALEQVTPVVPQGTFSVTMRKVPLVLLLPPQWSWARVYSQLPSKLYHSPSKVMKWPSP